MKVRYISYVFFIAIIFIGFQAFAASDLIVTDRSDKNIFHLTPSIFVIIISSLVSVVWLLSWKILNRIEKRQDDLYQDFQKFKEELPKTYISRIEFEKILEMTSKSCREKMDHILSEFHRINRVDMKKSRDWGNEN